MTVYTITSSDLKSAWKNVHPAQWQGYYDRLEQQISAKAAQLNETVHFHEYNSPTPLGGTALLMECSDAMAAVVKVMPEVYAMIPQSSFPTVRRAVKQNGPQP